MESDKSPLEQLPTDIHLVLADHARLTDALSLTQSCKALYGLTSLRAWWLAGLRSERRHAPLACQLYDSLESHDLMRLKTIASRTLARDRNWALPEPVLVSYSSYMTAIRGDVPEMLSLIEGTDIMISFFRPTLTMSCWNQRLHRWYDVPGVRLDWPIYSTSPTSDTKDTHSFCFLASDDSHSNVVRQFGVVVLHHSQGEPIRLEITLKHPLDLPTGPRLELFMGNQYAGILKTPCYPWSPVHGDPPLATFFDLTTLELIEYPLSGKRYTGFWNRLDGSPNWLDMSLGIFCLDDQLYFCTQDEDSITFERFNQEKQTTEPTILSSWPAALPRPTAGELSPLALSYPNYGVCAILIRHNDLWGEQTPSTSFEFCPSSWAKGKLDLAPASVVLPGTVSTGVGTRYMYSGNMSGVALVVLLVVRHAAGEVQSEESDSSEDMVIARPDVNTLYLIRYHPDEHRVSSHVLAVPEFLKPDEADFLNFDEVLGLVHWVDEAGMLTTLHYA